MEHARAGARRRGPRAETPKRESLRFPWIEQRLGGLGQGVGTWLALLVCVAGSLLTVATWNSLTTVQASELETTLESTCSELARLLETRFSRQHDELSHLGENWNQFGVADVARWQAEALLFMRRWEEFPALEWDDGSPGPITTKAATTPEGLELLEAMRADPAAAQAHEHAVEVGAEAFLGPVASLEGKPIYEVIIPIGQTENPRPVICALLEPALILERNLSHRASPCALTVTANVVEIYRRGEPAPGLGLERFQPVHVHAQQEWTLKVEPGEEQLSAPYRRLPWVVLGAGLIISVLLATLVRIGLSSSAHAQRLFGANLELVEHLRDLERADEKNRDLGQENQALIEQHGLLTGEIATQNRALEKQELALERERKGRQELANEVETLKSEVVQREAGEQDSDRTVAELEAFTYSVSHDLRSPLGAILNYTAILAEDYADKLDDSAQEHLARISGSARNAVAMMDGLLAFSRVGRHELVLTEVDLRALVREIHDELSRALAEKQIQPPELSMGELPPLRADGILLRVLFTNLLSNAFKFTRGVEQPRVEVGGYAQGASTVYYVEDNGIGFDMRHVNKLFGVFERLVPQAEYEGHGVGLAIVQRIAQRHGGSVRAEGAPGKGATFFVSFPASHETHDQPPP